MNVKHSRRDWFESIGRAAVGSLPLVIGPGAALGSTPAGRLGLPRPQEERPGDGDPPGTGPGRTSDVDEKGEDGLKFVLSQLSMQRRLLASLPRPDGTRVAEGDAFDTLGFFDKAAEDRYRSFGVSGVELSVVMLEIDPFFGITRRMKPDSSGPRWADLREKAGQTLPVHRLLIDKDNFAATDLSNQAASPAGGVNYDPAGWYESWFGVAAALGCKEVALLLEPVGGYDEQLEQAASRIATLCEKAKSIGNLKVRVEPRGPLATDGRWSAALAKKVAAKGGEEQFGILLNIAMLTYDPERVIDDLGDAIKSVVLEYKDFVQIPGTGGEEQQIRERSIPFQDFVPGLPFVKAPPDKSSDEIPVTVRYLGSQNEETGSEYALRAAKQLLPRPPGG